MCQNKTRFVQQIDRKLSEEQVESLKKAGNTNVLCTRYDDAPGFPAGGGKGHASYELAFKEEKLYKWLLEQSLSGNKSDL